MIKVSHGEYDPPWVVALRQASGASLCADDECNLSGGRAHIGMCEPCDCWMHHAVEECPINRAELCVECKGTGIVVCEPCNGSGKISAKG